MELFPSGDGIGVTAGGVGFDGGAKTAGGALGGAGFGAATGGALGFAGSGVGPPTGTVEPFICANAAVADMAPQAKATVKVLLKRVLRVANDWFGFLFIVIWAECLRAHIEASGIFVLHAIERQLRLAFGK